MTEAEVIGDISCKFTFNGQNVVHPVNVYKCLLLVFNMFKIRELGSGLWLATSYAQAEKT